MFFKLGIFSSILLIACGSFSNEEASVAGPNIGIIIIPSDGEVCEIIQVSHAVFNGIPSSSGKPHQLQRRNADDDDDDVNIVIIILEDDDEVHDDHANHKGEMKPVRIISSDGNEDEIDEDAAIYTGIVVRGENGEKKVLVSTGKEGGFFEMDYYSCEIIDSSEFEDASISGQNTIVILAKPIDDKL